MDVCKIAIFLYCYLPIHLISDLSNHWMEKRGKPKAILLHSFLYTLFFIPLFWRLEINFLWLIFVFLSHFIIDSQWDLLFRIARKSQCHPLFLIVSKILRHENETESNLRFYTAVLDQVLHLCIPIIIVLSIISMP